MAAGRMPGFGDDDFAPTDAGASLARLAEAWARDPTRRPGQSAPVRTACARRRAGRGGGRALRGAAAAAEADGSPSRPATWSPRRPPMTDGRPVLRLQPAAGQVTLLSPEQARRAITGGPPPTELGAPGIVPVEASPPAVAVRVSDGPAGRLLVIAAEEEPGWQATIDGRRSRWCGRGATWSASRSRSRRRRSGSSSRPRCAASCC